MLAGAGTPGQLRLPAEDGHQLMQRGGAPYLGPQDQRGFPHVTEGDDQAQGGGTIGQGDHARDVAQRAVEPEFPAEGEPVGASGAQLAGSDEQPHRDGEVETGATFADTGGSEIHGETSKGPRQPAREDGGARPCRDSRTAASGNPTMVNPGRPFETCTSTETALPTAPVRVADAMTAWCTRMNGRLRRLPMCTEIGGR